MNKRIYFICLLLLFTFSILSVHAQVGTKEKINQLNNKGQKEGYWREQIEGYGIVESYYRNGKQSGISKDISRQGRLSIFAEYINGLPCGTWYFFNDNGTLDFLLKNFSINESWVSSDDGKKYKPLYKSYMISYYSNGNIESEGLLLWDDDPRSDESFTYGEWKYYDEAGKLERTEYFKNDTR